MSSTEGSRPRWTGLPPKQGLYDPAFEHDACGVGFVVDIKGRKSHRILQQGLQVLTNLDHRGACGAEANTGDGAGVLLQMPHKFLVEACKKARIELARARASTAAASCSCRAIRRCAGASKSASSRSCSPKARPCSAGARCRRNNSMLGETAKSCEPFMRQVFIGRNPAIADELAFERKLYVIRKRAYSEIRTSTLEGAASLVRREPVAQDARLQRHAADEQLAPVLPGSAAIR